ncbi:hypothetical protein Tco_0639854 [Tanacetum coccineum]
MPNLSERNPYRMLLSWRWLEKTLVGGECGSLSRTLGESDVDEVGDLGDGVFVSSWVKSTNNCFGGMMLNFVYLETLEMEALVDAMDVDNG